MSDIAIRVENLSKLYRIGQTVGYKTLRESLTSVFSTPFRRLRSIRHEPPAISHEPSAISHQPRATSYQPSATSHQPRAISYQL